MSEMVLEIPLNRWENVSPTAIGKSQAAVQYLTYAKKDIATLAAAHKAALERIRRLEGVLRPFSQLADIEHRALDGETVMVNVSRCREARAALRGVS